MTNGTLLLYHPCHGMKHSIFTHHCRNMCRAACKPSDSSSLGLGVAAEPVNLPWFVLTKYLTMSGAANGEDGGRASGWGLAPLPLVIFH